MDLKATALLKLIYLEMFGHDMSWASFHVLEVMSSPKYLQKRVGYLAAVQSFRPDTEVLMLATNLLKKVYRAIPGASKHWLIRDQDVSSPMPPTISLPLIALPHVITSSLAMSLLNDLLPRLSHTGASIRKKTVAALYRLALVYPDTLKSAWPKIKDLLLDDQQDTSVTAAIVNVVCELGWRRPTDFLPLAPRFFELLVESGNNWMAIKVIKLFASLIPLEPRLTRKLSAPLTTLIQTTPAMSLLYECINGVIEGGILEGIDSACEGEELASLCVTKLRAMIIIDGDPNLKYVALLAFKKVVTSHPHLVSMQEDVILDCLEDADISIRLKALDLGAGMVSGGNLVNVVERLVRQLATTPDHNDFIDERGVQSYSVEPAADSDDEKFEDVMRPNHEGKDRQQALPTEYRINLIQSVIEMCSRDTYVNVTDFEWYLEVLSQLLEAAPFRIKSNSQDATRCLQHDRNVFTLIGEELRNVAVRVSTVRDEIVRITNNLLADSRKVGTRVSDGNGYVYVLGFAAWVSGEYIKEGTDATSTLDSLLHPGIASFPSSVVCAYLQAIPKVLAHVSCEPPSHWDRERSSMAGLVIERLIKFLEPLTHHPDLDVQERAVELAEFVKIASQAVVRSRSDVDSEPRLLTKALPNLFTAFEMNPVAASAQRKVPLPPKLDLTSPINAKLPKLLLDADLEDTANADSNEFNNLYDRRSARMANSDSGQDILPSIEDESVYQHTGSSTLNTNEKLRKLLERRERNKDDPFYIGGEQKSSGASTPFHQILQDSNGENLDLDSIPIMDLQVGLHQSVSNVSEEEAKKHKKRRPRKVHVIRDITINHGGIDQLQEETLTRAPAGRTHLLADADNKQKALLQVDSSGLSQISDSNKWSTEDLAGKGDDELEMARALAEVEQLRLEMQRASERIQATDGAPAEGTLVKKKKKKRLKQPNNKPGDQENIASKPTVVGAGGLKAKKEKKGRNEDYAAAMTAENGE